MRSRSNIKALALAVMTGISLAAFAGDTRFTNNDGTGDNLWTNAANWTAGLPVSTNRTDFRTNVVCNLDAPAQSYGMNFRGDSGSNCIVNVLSGGALESNGEGWSGRNWIGADVLATLNIFTNGSVVLSGTDVTKLGYVSGATGIINVNGGSLDLQQDVIVGAKSGGTGIINLNGGNVVVSNLIDLSSLSGSTGIVNIADGTFVVNSNFYVGGRTYAEVNISGGELVCTNGFDAQFGFRSSSIGNLSQTGGNAIFKNLHLPNLGHSDLVMSGGTNQADNIYLGRRAGATSSALISGGYLKTTGNLGLGWDENSEATLRIEGGHVVSINLAMGPMNDDSTQSTIELMGGQIDVTVLESDSIQYSTNETFHIEGGVLKLRRKGQANNITVFETMIDSNVVTWAGAPEGSGRDPVLATSSWTNGSGEVLYIQEGTSWDFIWAEAIAPLYYSEWAAEYDLTGSDTNLTANPDNDSMDNLTEYGLGGNPTNANDVGIVPVAEMVAEGGTNWFEYVYRRRTDAAERGLTYEVQNDDNLVNAPNWTNDFVEVGFGPIDSDFETVTNRISTEGESQEFGRLQIGINE